ncbi:hypothetical protein MKW94_019710, partial [Papaver nudicaule]|nr:hypothetical protein [Papaver nudicaule]
AIELMFVDVMLEAHVYYDFLSQIKDPAEYWKLDDTILKTIETESAQELQKAKELILRIRRRDLYQ